MQKAAKNEKFLEFIPYLLIAGILLVGYLLYSLLAGFLDASVSFNIVLPGCAAVLLALAVYLICRTERLTTAQIVMVLIFIGLLLRLAYML